MEKATTVTVNSCLVVTFNKVGLATAVAGLGLVSMTVGAARKEITEGLLVRVLANWDMGEVEQHAVFPARKTAKPSAPAFVGLLASSTVMIFPSGSQLRSEFPRNRRHSAYRPACAAQRVKPGKSLQIVAKKNEGLRPPYPARPGTAGISGAIEYDFTKLERGRACGARRA
jgi:hypothetical protein